MAINSVLAQVLSVNAVTTVVVVVVVGVVVVVAGLRQIGSSVDRQGRTPDENYF